MIKVNGLTFTTPKETTYIANKFGVRRPRCCRVTGADEKKCGTETTYFIEEFTQTPLPEGQDKKNQLSHVGTVGALWLLENTPRSGGCVVDVETKRIYIGNSVCTKCAAHGDARTRYASSGINPDIKQSSYLDPGNLDGFAMTENEKETYRIEYRREIAALQGKSQSWNNANPEYTKRRK